MRAVWLGPWMLWRLCLVGVLSVLGLRCGVWDMTYDGGLGLSGLVSAGVFLFWDISQSYFELRIIKVMLN